MNSMQENDSDAFYFLFITHQFLHEKFLLVGIPVPTFLSKLKPTLDTIITFHFNNLLVDVSVTAFGNLISLEG